MFLRKPSGQRTAILSDGSVLTLADLPTSDARWVAKRKATVVAAVAHNLLTRSEALRRYDLTEEEFASWEAAISKGGINALKVRELRPLRLIETGAASPGPVSDRRSRR